MHKSREFPIEASSQDAAISLAKEQMRPGEQVHNIYQKVSPARNRKGIYVLVVNVEPMVHSALIVAIVTHRASIQMLSSELVVFKIGAFGSAQLWFKAPLAAIEQLSLSSPHMIVRSPEGKKLSVTFNSRHDAEIARANLFLLVQEPDASKGEPVAGDLSSQTNAPTSPPTVPVLSAAVASELQRSPESLRAAKSNLHFTQMIGGAVAFVIGVAVTALTYSGASGPSGGTYFVLWGAMLFGPILFVRGLIGWTANRRGVMDEKATPIESGDSMIREIVPASEAVDQLPKGTCPNCSKTIALSCAECRYCKASFGVNASWRVQPMRGSVRADDA